MKTRATPWGRDSGMELSTATQGHMTPLFLGGSLSSQPYMRPWDAGGRLQIG